MCFDFIVLLCCCVALSWVMALRPTYRGRIRNPGQVFVMVVFPLLGITLALL